jgi:hypothetical protein
MLLKPRHRVRSSGHRPRQGHVPVGADGLLELSRNRFAQSGRRDHRAVAEIGRT